MKFVACVNIGMVRVFSGEKRAKVISDALNGNLCRKLSYGWAWLNALKADAVRLSPFAIAYIFRLVSEPQIARLIVIGIAVDVIDNFCLQGDSAVCQSKYDAMRPVFFAICPNLEVAPRIAPASGVLGVSPVEREPSVPRLEV
jgi:hypothetical protein